MEITKREAIVSVAIAAIMLIFGFVISGKVEDYQNDRNAEYQKAVHIESTELFQYGMDTNIGNAFVYGDLKAVDTVTFDEIGGEYMYVEKVEEHYNRHTRTVTKTRTVNGKTQTYTDTEVYYSWDYYDSWDKHSEKISFCGIEFDYEKIDIPSSNYIDTLDGGFHIRYKYYGVKPQHTGTLYSSLADHTIKDNSNFLANYTIDQALDRYTSDIAIIIFWCAWVLLSGFIIGGFYYIDNWWLE